MWNPLDWLKVFYENVGHKSPVLSAVGFTILFALFGLAVWWRVDAQYTKDHPPVVQAAPPKPESPIITRSPSQPANRAERSSWIIPGVIPFPEIA